MAERAGTAQPTEEQVQGQLTNVYKYLMGGCKEDGAWLVLVMPSDRTRGNRDKQKQMKFYLNTRIHFFTMKVVKHRNCLDRKVVGSPFSEILKNAWTQSWATCYSWLWDSVSRREETGAIKLEVASGSVANSSKSQITTLSLCCVGS